MRVRRIVAWVGLGLFVIAAPAIGLVGAALWQEYAPASLRQVILTAAALTEPGQVDRMLESIGIAAEEKPANPG